MQDQLTVDVSPPAGVGGKLWERMILAAYMLQVLPGSRRKVCEVTGFAESTLRRYEKSEHWDRAIDVATDRWLDDMTAQARAKLHTLIATENDGKNARWLLDRTVERLRPPAQRQELTASGGGAAIFVFGSAPAGILRAAPIQQGGERPAHVPPMDSPEDGIAPAVVVGTLAPGDRDADT